MKEIYKYLKNEIIFGINIWNFLSTICSICVFLPIFLIISNFYIESENWLHIRNNLLIEYISTTLYLIVGVCIVSTTLGVGCAWFVTCYEFYGKKYIEWLLILPLTIPTYIAAYSYYDILEYFNPILFWTRNKIGLDYTIMIENILIYVIVIMLFSFVLYPYIYLSARASLIVQGGRVIEAANTLGVPTNKLLRKVVIPIIRPGIIAGVSLVVMETLNDYAAVEYFGLSTLTIGVFRSWFGMFDVGSALKLSSFLALFVFIILVIEKFYRGGARYNNSQGLSGLQAINLHKKKQIMIFVFCFIPFFFGFLIPVVRLSSWMLRSDVVIHGYNLLGTALNTLFISFASSIFIVLFASLVIFTKNYFNNDALKKVAGLAILGYSMPGAIIAIGVLKLYGSIDDYIPLIFIGSIAGLVFSYLVRFLAVAWQPIESSVKKLGANVSQASRMLNVNPSKSLMHIYLPILKKPILIACLIVFIDISKELPLTLILKPSDFQTLATLTYDLVVQAQFYQSSVPSLFIILISTPAILIINRQVIKGSK